MTQKNFARRYREKFPIWSSYVFYSTHPPQKSSFFVFIAQTSGRNRREKSQIGKGFREVKHVGQLQLSFATLSNNLPHPRFSCLF